ncbi:MAG: hypothetical protein R3C39_08715 [Dehalococcoidia bacterium]
MTRWVLVALHSMLGLSAVWAGQEFVRHPDGRGLGMSPDYLKGSPFPDFRVPGLFLGVVISGWNLASAAALARRSALGPPISVATGVLLLVWMAIQTAILGPRHWTQLLWWAVFGLVTALAAHLVRREPRG